MTLCLDIMACVHHSLPYPTFLHAHTATSAARALSGVGRVRVHPLTCPGAEGSSAPLAEYEAIVEKNVEQSRVDEGDKSDKESAKLRKRYMKEGVAMAQRYLAETLGLDVSVTSVEVVLSIDSVLRTDGCLASCFLDAGCSHVVIRVKGGDVAGALGACDATRVPRERLILQWKSGEGMFPESVRSQMAAIEERVGTLSIQHTTPVSSEMLEWEELKAWKQGSKGKDLRCIVQLSFASDVSIDDLSATVQSISKVFDEDTGAISLVDPTATQLGMSYAACLKTDRADGFYPTVVVTRSNEALGLVYSSKVCPTPSTSLCILLLVPSDSLAYPRSRSSPPSNAGGASTGPGRAAVSGARATRPAATRPCTRSTRTATATPSGSW